MQPKSKAFLVRQYGADPKAPWHVVRQDNVTVCGRGAVRGKAQTEQGAGFVAGVLTGFVLPIDRLCSSCERMREAEGMLLKGPR